MEMEMDDVLVQYNGNVKNAYHLPQSYLDVLQINERTMESIVSHDECHLHMRYVHAARRI